MQRRFHISYHPDFDSALSAKNILLEKSPNNDYQIRRKSKNFELVGRVASKDAKAYLENTVGMYSKKRKPKRPPRNRKVDWSLQI